MKRDTTTMQVFEKDYGWKHDDTGVAHRVIARFLNNNTCVVQEEFYNAFAPSIIVILSTTLI